jgi:glycine/D-amino acid oxidase-like deaminating enzyme
MARQRSTSKRVVIVGGGISGLSIATRLSQAGLPVTVVESSRLGFGASTRNQGWLLSGAWFAPRHVELARMCHEALLQSLRFCPDGPEPECRPMVYLLGNDRSDSGAWTTAWRAAGIPYSGMTAETLVTLFPNMVIPAAGEAFELPDRAVRIDRLLRRLASAAEHSGAEIRMDSPVTRLIRRDDVIEGVEIGGGETLPARLVILAGNAAGRSLDPERGAGAVGAQPQVDLVALKTHLVALRPAISRTPLCVVDAGGFNHIPHPPVSVFGSNRWLPAHGAEDERVDATEMARIWEQLGRLFPNIRREEHVVREWAGTTIEAMRAEQVEPGEGPLPVVIDHQWGTPAVENLLSVFPGRASLWPHLAEQTRETVFRKLDPVSTSVAAPPWGTSSEYPQTPSRGGPQNESVYHCQECGRIAIQEQSDAPPICCAKPMASAGTCASGSVRTY